MRRTLFSIGLLVLLSGFWEGDWVSAAGGDKAQTNAPQKKTVNPADFVGSETCETCHEDINKKFAENPHSRLAMLHGGKGVTCESCHGPGKEHVEAGGDPTKIFQFSKATPKATDEKCLECHATAHPNFERTAHGEAGVGCASCHSIHKFDSKASLLKVEQPKLCYICHSDIKPAFSQPFHHRIDEGLKS